MTLFRTSTCFKFHLPAEALDEMSSDLLDALFEVEGVIEADLEATLARGEIQIAFYVEAQDPDDALKAAAKAIDSALVAMQRSNVREHGFRDDLDRKVVSAARVPVAV